jgi:uncharacterized protein (TIGR02687 family)
MDRIAQALSKAFDRHRIIFWYDSKKELRSEFEELNLADIEKIELNNNEFGVKYRILREQPNQKFLLYHEGRQPNDLENWLLDVQLAYGDFRTDQVGLWLGELELGLEFADVVYDHSEFFKAVKRRESLKDLLKPDDTPGMIRVKMLAVCVGAEPRIDEILESILAEYSEEREEKLKLLQRCALDGFLWDQLKRYYGYASESAGIKDFVIELFKSCYIEGTGGISRLSNDALVFLKRWKDSIRHHQAFEQLSEQCAELLAIEQDLQKRDFSELLEMDYFRLIDQKIISDLVVSVSERTISAGDCAVLVRQRRQSHWYKEFRHLYEAIDFAAQFIFLLDKTVLSSDSLADGVNKYCQSWFKLDQLYRKYVFHVRKSGMNSLMQRLTDQVESLYTNAYLLKMNDHWQAIVDGIDYWDAPPVIKQDRFFAQWVQPFLKNNKKVYVIISDAMRYEVGEELLRLIRKEDRYDAQLDPVLSMLPSYTQMGMAALLPNHSITIEEDESGTVLVDGQSSKGTQNRNKILDHAISQSACAVRAEDVLKLNKQDCRELVRDHDVVYVYHNQIDMTGDKRDSEERVFEAVEDTLVELIKIIKKLTAANASNLLVTADHGFIYQNRPIEESDFADTEVSGDTVLYRDRRFVLGKDLTPQASLRKFTAAEAGLQGNMEIQLPKSINRLRLQGSGSRFVHGGASLHEVVVPVLQINKKRRSDITAVEVDILRGASSVITSGQLAVALYQLEPASDKVQPRLLRAGIYTQEGELISDTHELAFDLVSENPREREIKVRFVLTRLADEANGQEVILCLDERLADTSHYREYKSVRYEMRRSFTSDFDF